MPVRDPSFYVSSLLELHRVVDETERRTVWRQSIATLARVSSEEGPGPLDGIHPDALVRGIRAAIAGGLVDDLDWLDPAAAGIALYELAAALPLGPEQRDLGRRVLARVLAGNAETFVGLATRMALGTGKGLNSVAVRARIGLVTELPIGLGIHDGPLALALASRRELAREWIGGPSTGSLPARRLAARLLERAAREAARRAQRSDSHPLRAFQGEAASGAWKRLLADRESLVWRHVAVARGLLSPWVPELAAAVERSIAATLSPTEWRRGATSIAALVGVDPERGLKLARLAVSTGMIDRDPGVAAAFMWGLSRAAEGEPDAASELISIVMSRAPVDIAESVLELRAEYGQSQLVDKALSLALDALRQKPIPPGGEEGAEALAREVILDLERTHRDLEPVREQLLRALCTFASEGARSAYSAARDVLDSATSEMDVLDAVGRDETERGGRAAASTARRTALAVLRDLDIALLERNVLADLLKLGARTDSIRTNDDALDGVRDRLSEWILMRESSPFEVSEGVIVTGSSEAPLSAANPNYPALRLRRLRALLHLVDSDVGDAQDDGTRAARLRRRWIRIAKALLVRFERDPPSVLRRTIQAALARALDALVREGACDVADVLLVLARPTVDPGEFETLAEASMDPDLVHVLSRFARFVRESSSPPRSRSFRAGRTEDSMFPHTGTGGSSPSLTPDIAKQLRALEEFANEMMPDASSRTEALRNVLVRLHAALQAIAGAESLRSLSSSGGSEPDVIESLEQSLVALSQMSSGARSRFDPPDKAAMGSSPSHSRPLSVAISRVMSGAELRLTDHMVGTAVDDLVAGIPRAIARVVSAVTWPLADLPSEPPSVRSKAAVAAVPEHQLPAWLPARRTIGGFYVLRALGAGAVGSVFVVNRVEDRHDPHAERFALKVPDYSASAARRLSEVEFLQMFRAEASALIALPPHANLARFVTFDLAARPKPILVMELVEGTTLERIIESRGLDIKRCLRTLDDVLAGLEVMHGAGVGHLDLKPSNVVLRHGDEAVLVDFGLAGRHVRPGCATGPYGAPEVWGAPPDGVRLDPLKADVYAFGCVAYEALTGNILFDADTEFGQIALHVAHDGRPAPLVALAANPAFAPLVDVLSTALRREPTARATVSQLRANLRRLVSQLARARWPIIP